MKPIIFALPGSEAFGQRFAQSLEVDTGEVAVRRFPDGESWVRVLSNCAERDAIVVADLNRPDSKICQLVFLAQTLRDLGAGRVGLVAPYLAYMRQDEQFEPGEAVTSSYFSELIAHYFEWLVTLDPHLHRRGSLAEIYRIPAFAAQSAPFISRWADRLDEELVLVGPDAESEQWVGEVARQVECAHFIFEKTRHGDRDVELGEADLERFEGLRPVIFDDIISTGTTMLETIARLRRNGMADPYCVGIHGVFAGDAHARLLEAGAAKVLTTNSIAHPTNAIDIAPALSEKIAVALQHTAVEAAE